MLSLGVEALLNALGCALLVILHMAALVSLVSFDPPGWAVLVFVGSLLLIPSIAAIVVHLTVCRKLQ